jgi:hypothetical protein
VTEPFLAAAEPDGQVTAIVLLFHGGTVRSLRPDRRAGLAALRMYSFLRRLGAAGRPRGVFSAVVRYTALGWNGGIPLDDGRLAIDEARRRHPGVPMCLVGHSLGGRVGLRLAGLEEVVAVCALAPWLPPGEPVRQLAGRTVLILQGDRDTTTPPADSLAYAREAAAVTDRLARLEVVGAGHKLITRSAVWHDLALRFTLGALGLAEMGPELDAAFALSPRERLRLPV